MTIREEQRDGETVWTFTSVSHDRLKSAPAKGTRRDFQIHHQGRCLGRADRGSGGPNRPWTLDGSEALRPSASYEEVTWLRLEVLDVLR